MKLLKSDIKALSEWGNTEEDIAQIEEFISYGRMKYIINDKRISVKELLKNMSRKEWLSGIERATFHYSSVRQTLDGQNVFFDCGDYWSKIIKG